MEGGIIMNVDQMLADPTLKNLEKGVEIVTKRFEFRLFKRLFRFDIIREGFNPPHLLAPVEPCQSSTLAAWVCDVTTDPYYLKAKADRLAQWHKEQDESFARMSKDPRIKNTEDGSNL